MQERRSSEREEANLKRKANGFKMPSTVLLFFPRQQIIKSYSPYMSFIFIIALLVSTDLVTGTSGLSSSSPPVATSNLSPAIPTTNSWTKGLYAQSSYYYADYKIPPQAPPPEKLNFLPGLQICPETGSTVCEDVDKYPE